MVLTRSRSRQQSTAASRVSTSAHKSGSTSSNSAGIPPSSLSHVYSEQCWRQRTIRLTKRASADEPTHSAVDRQRRDTADRYLTLTCRQHSPRTREYIVRSDAPLLNTVDCVVAALTAIVLAWLVFVWWPEQWIEPHTAIALIPLALTVASKLQTVKQESVLCIGALGVQLSTVYVFGRTTRRFFDLAAIDTVILHEGISFYRVVDYLAIVLKDKKRAGAGGSGSDVLQASTSKESGKRLIIIFEHLRPRLCVIRRVWQGMRCVLYDEPE